MRIGGAAAYFGVIDEHRDALINMDEALPDTEIVGRIFETTRGLHEEIDNTIRKLRRRAGKDKTPLDYKQVRHAIIDTFKYDIPDAEKIAPPNTPILPSAPTAPATSAKRTPLANLADTAPQPSERDQEDKKDKRRKFAKGSCKHHPQATTHTTKMCFKTKREKKGLPAGRQWCTVHKRGVHYEDECFRHKNRSANAASTGWSMIQQPFNPHHQQQFLPHGGWQVQQHPQWAPSGTIAPQSRAPATGPPMGTVNASNASPTIPTVNALVANIRNLSQHEKEMLTQQLGVALQSQQL